MSNLPLRTAVLLAAALAVTACKKEQPAEAPAATEPGTAGESAEAAAAAEDSLEEQPLVINDDVVERYLAMWGQHQELVARVVKEVDQTLKELEEKGEVSGAMHAMRRGQEIETRLAKDEAKLRREFRFEERELERLQDFFGQLASSLQLAKAVPAEKLISDMRAQMAQLPAEQRAEAEKEIDQMESDFQAQRELKDLRGEFGDEAVDAALKHGDEILKMQERQLQILKDLP